MLSFIETSGTLLLVGVAAATTFLTIVAVTLVAIDRRRPQLRSPLVTVALAYSTALAAYVTYSMITANAEGRGGLVPAAGALGALALGGVLWWRGHGTFITVVGYFGAFVVWLFLINPIAWAFIGTWVIALLALLLAAETFAILGRYGRTAQGPRSD